jgi:DNA-binding HxlR family transcriptional regulator
MNMKTVDERLCPKVEAAFALLAKKWAGLIVFMLCEGEQHFNQLKDSIPSLSSRLLALRMRELEEAGLVERRVSGDSPVRVTYKLNKKGEELASILDGIAEWAKD